MQDPSLNVHSHFDKIASKYEEDARVMKDLIIYLLAICPPLTAESVVLDNACGPGIVTGEILKLPASQVPATLYAADFSSKMIDALRAKASRDGIEGQRWKAVQAKVMDAQNLDGYEDDMFTHSFTASAIFCIPDADKAAGEIYRTLKPVDGVAVVTTWATLGYVAHYHRAVQAVSPDMPIFSFPLVREWMTDTKLRSVMEAGGFKHENIEFSTVSCYMTMSEWNNMQHDLKFALSNMVTKGWTDENKAKFENELQREVAEGIERNDILELKAWVARARK
jgi:ubiquinone/menaquinone biosynthesis C-methylase UbiE